MTREAARDWWIDEISKAEEFLNIRQRQKDGRELNEGEKEKIALMYQRPRLREVLGVLEEVETRLVGGVGG